MDIKNQAKHIVERYMLEPGQRITDVIVGQAAVKVSTKYRWWLVRPIEEGADLVKSQGYKLYDVQSSVRTFPRSRSHGVAILDEGEMFLLDDEEGFRSFFRQAHALLEPLELATLLAHYQSQAEGNEKVIVQLQDLTGLITEEQISSIVEFTLPDVTTHEDGSMAIHFSTFYLAPAPPDYVIRVNLNRWLVNAGADGELDWTVRDIARNLESPRYAPD